MQKCSRSGQPAAGRAQCNKMQVVCQARASNGYSASNYGAAAATTMENRPGVLVRVRRAFLLQCGDLMSWKSIFRSSFGPLTLLPTCQFATDAPQSLMFPLLDDYQPQDSTPDMTTLESSLASNLPLVQLPLASSSCTPRVRAFAPHSRSVVHLKNCCKSFMFAVLINVFLHGLSTAALCSCESLAFHVLLHFWKALEVRPSCHLMRVIYQYSVHVPSRPLRNRNQVPNFLRTRHPLPALILPTYLPSSCF